MIDEGLQVVAFCPLKMRIISEKNHAERSEIEFPLALRLRVDANLVDLGIIDQHIVLLRPIEGDAILAIFLVLPLPPHGLAMAH